jgi:glycosyltransferase involved in cell wall biosynthesis
VLLGVPLANLLGRSIIIDIRDIPLVDLEHSLLKVACRYASKIWTVTTWLAGYLASNYNIKPAKILVVSNGINVRLVAEEMVHSIRDPAFFTIVLVGDLDQPYLLTENILRAIPSVSKKISNLRVFVVGEGLKKQYLIELCKQSGISEKITFTGLLSLREVYRLLLSADLSIVGYKTRYHKLDDFMLTVPTKVIESICCGVPLLAIASRNSYLADLIIGNKLGIVIESDEPSVIADSIVDAYSRMENFRQCSESFRNRALAQYDQRQIFINALRSSRL